MRARVGKENQQGMRSHLCDGHPMVDRKHRREARRGPRTKGDKSANEALLQAHAVTT